MGAVVLVVEDQREVRDVVRRYLERAGHTVLSTASGAEALNLLDRSEIELAVLDLGLPDVPGEEVLAVARERDLPVLVLTARASVGDRIRGLEQGADDYLAKPFSPRELVLRVQAVLHRSSGRSAAADVPSSYGGGLLRIDRVRHEVSVGGQPVELTPTEWGVLVALADTPGRVFSRYELVNQVRGYEFRGYERTIDSHVHNLREKLRQGNADVEIVETVLGVGYRLGIRSDV